MRTGPSRRVPDRPRCRASQVSLEVTKGRVDASSPRFPTDAAEESCDVLKQRTSLSRT